MTGEDQARHVRGFQRALTAAAGHLLNEMEHLPKGSSEESAYAAAAMQLTSYGFWVRRGWVDPFALTGVLVNGRSPGMVMPGEPGYPFPLAPALRKVDE